MQNFESAERLGTTVERHEKLMGELFAELNKFTGNPNRDLYDKIELSAETALAFSDAFGKMSELFMLAGMLAMNGDGSNCKGIKDSLEKLVPKGVKAMTDFLKVHESVRSELYVEVYKQVCADYGEESAGKMMTGKKGWDECIEAYENILGTIKEHNV